MTRPRAPPRTNAEAYTYPGELEQYALVYEYEAMDYEGIDEQLQDDVPSYVYD